MNLLNRLTRTTAKVLFHTASIKGYLEPLIQQFKPEWRDGYYRAKVVKIIHLGANCISLELKPERRWPSHTAGQHVLLTAQINGRLMSRPFSISSSEGQANHENRIRLTIKTSENGAFTGQLLAFLGQGDFVNISAPQGDFRVLPNKTPLFLVAAGSGITPFMAMLHSVYERQTGAVRPIHLLYFAKPNQHLFTDELATLSSQQPSFSLKLLARSQGDSLSNVLKGCVSTDQVMICGPADFKHQVDNELDQLNHNPLYRQAEFYQPPLIQTENENDSPRLAITVNYAGKQQQLHTDNNSALLNTLEQQGIQANFGCRIGVCHQCQCVKKSGVVKNIKTGQLSQNGQQLIQLCISQAVTPLELEL
ncbi:hypothetical protein PULV_a0868 [Pseudoalteromonas ulvae UL12]|uniref:FAD-binding FR-type domain-containing protein n=1 Tax=Pseudoalteromonas ulvae TaxID=107327 RepID=A0A244CRS3_PSEDV|nr:iron-sulfur cluster-binding domain-containing protein [Pseudoalteromonas ulvae]MBE0363430.1 hypothetical protein [Pseudoalteromonas ulvae UL12]OUL58312.1 hypothetical protein B1199_08230 [Pseudoalteromonas ulvae]